MAKPERPLDDTVLLAQKQYKGYALFIWQCKQFAQMQQQ